MKIKFDFLKSLKWSLSQKKGETKKAEARQELTEYKRKLIQNPPHIKQEEFKMNETDYFLKPTGDIKEYVKSTHPTYAIGVDTYDKNNYSYSLTKKVNENIEFILCKTMPNKEKFNEEVENLSKYFNAKIYENKE